MAASLSAKSHQSILYTVMGSQYITNYKGYGELITAKVAKYTVI